VGVFQHRITILAACAFLATFVINVVYFAAAEPAEERPGRVGSDSEVVHPLDNPGVGRCALLLHGLARTKLSMRPVARALKASGWHVVNLGYPSRRGTIEVLSAKVADGIALCLEKVDETSKIDIVTHSMGGMLLRQWHADTHTPIGRAVMLGPPNHGSELVDYLGRTIAFRFYNGPAGRQLGTDAGAHWRSLPAVDFELGVIAGKGSGGSFLGRHVPAPNDGKVSVASTRVQGMEDHISLSVGHTFLMNDERVQLQIISFLARGSFSAASMQ